MSIDKINLVMFRYRLNEICLSNEKYPCTVNELYTLTTARPQAFLSTLKFNVVHARTLACLRLVGIYKVC